MIRQYAILCPVQETFQGSLTTVRAKLSYNTLLSVLPHTTDLSNMQTLVFLWLSCFNLNLHKLTSTDYLPIVSNFELTVCGLCLSRPESIKDVSTLYRTTPSSLGFFHRDSKLSLLGYSSVAIYPCLRYGPSASWCLVSHHFKRLRKSAVKNTYNTRPFTAV